MGSFAKGVLAVPSSGRGWSRSVERVDRLTVIAYSAESGSQAEDQLKLLAAWRATERTTATSAAADLEPEALPPDPESR